MGSAASHYQLSVCRLCMLPRPNDTIARCASEAARAQWRFGLISLWSSAKVIQTSGTVCGTMRIRHIVRACGRTAFRRPLRSVSMVTFPLRSAVRALKSGLHPERTWLNQALNQALKLSLNSAFWANDCVPGSTLNRNHNPLL